VDARCVACRLRQRLSCRNVSCRNVSCRNVSCRNVSCRNVSRRRGAETREDAAQRRNAHSRLPEPWRVPHSDPGAASEANRPGAGDFRGRGGVTRPIGPKDPTDETATWRTPMNFILPSNSWPLITSSIDLGTRFGTHSETAVLEQAPAGDGRKCSEMVHPDTAHPDTAHPETAHPETRCGARQRGPEWGPARLIVTATHSLDGSE
jgi:hypothetical protein